MINPLHKPRTLVLAFALLATVGSFAQEGGKGDPDRAVAGGQFPAGWSARPDRGAATGIKFSQAGDVYHFQMGTTGTMWRADWTKSGNYGCCCSKRREIFPALGKTDAKPHGDELRHKVKEN